MTAPGKHVKDTLIAVLGAGSVVTPAVAARFVGTRRANRKQ